MNNKLKLNFSAALAALVVGTCSALAAANPASTNAAPAAADTNANTNTPAVAMTSLFGDPVIAKGKGVEVKQSALDEVVLGIKSAAAARNQTIPPQQLMGIEAQMLNRLIQIQLLLQKSTAADKTAGAAKAEQQLTNLLARAGSQAAFDRQLKAVGMSPTELRTKITQEATATATLTRELGVTISDADATNFYNAHPTDFEQPELAHVRHILLLTIDPVTRAPLSADQIASKHKQIDGILQRAQSGEDFAQLATQYSEDPGSKDNGGELPPFGHGEMVPQFEAAAFSMKTNTISSVVTTDYGFHIIKLLDITPAQKVPYAKVADKIKDYLSQQKTEKLAPTYLAGLSKAAGVEILDPDLKAAAAALEAQAAMTNAPTSATVP
jgi:peptidyl-prolyl cis-trans isomerase C